MWDSINIFGIDKSDISTWASLPETKAFISEVKKLQGMSFRALLKDGEEKHGQNAGLYNAYERILRLIEEGK